MAKTKLGSSGNGKVVAAPAKGRRTRRTTLTLPVSLLKIAKGIAQDRHQSLSRTMTQLMEATLYTPYKPVERDIDEALASWRRAFTGFTERELLMLDGIYLEESEKIKK